VSFRALLIYFFISIQLGPHPALYSQILKNNLESELIIEKFHINDGLKSIRIFDIYSDLNNIIWIVTESSLYSFNGFTFDEKVNFGALRFHPQRIYIDNNKNLWLIEPQFQTKSSFEATIAKEIQILNGNTFESINVQEYLGVVPKESYNIFQNENGVIHFTLPNTNSYYSFDKELSIISPENQSNHFQLLHDQDFTSFATCDTIFIKSKIYDIDTFYNLRGTVINFKVKKDVFSYLEKIGNDFYIRSFKDNELKSIESTHLVYDLDENGNIWSFRHRKFLISDSILDNSVREALTNAGSLVFQSTLIDKHGNTWLGTQLGLIKISFKPILFNNICGEKFFSTRTIYQLPNEELIICSYEGIFTYNLEEKELKQVTNEVFLSLIKIDNQFLAFNRFGKYTVLDYPSFNPTKTKNYQIPINSQPIGSCSINNSENLILSKKKLLRLNSKTKRSIEIKKPNSNIRYHSLLEIKDHIYICSSNGVYTFSSELNSLIPILPGYEVYYVHIDAEDANIMWLASSLGLLRYNIVTKTVEVIGKDEGLSNTIFTSMLEDKFGALWLPSFTGLYKYNKLTGRINRYFIEDGLINNEFNHHSYLALENETFLFGGTNGITIIDPIKFANQNTANSGEEISIFSGYKIQKENPKMFLNIDDIENNSEINIYEKDIELRLTLHHPYYNDLQSKEVFYRLRAYDNQEASSWIPLKSNALSLSRKPYGKYKLELKAESRSGEPLSEIQEYSVIYHVPFYKKYWFFALEFFLIFLLLLYFFKRRSQVHDRKTELLEKEILLRTRLIKDQNFKLDKMNKTKDKLFAILAHDLKAPLITFQNLAGKIKYLIETDQAERLIDIGNSIDEKISRLSTFLDNLLNWSLQQRDHLSYNPEYVEISKMINEILELYDENLKNKKIEVITKVNPEHRYFADKNSVHAVVRNIISNALKYSYPNSKILIESSIEPSVYKLTIVDYGIGISDKRVEAIMNGINIDSYDGTNKEKGTGLGLLVSQELMKLNLGSLRILRNPSSGTTIELLFPKTETKRQLSQAISAEN